MGKQADKQESSGEKSVEVKIEAFWRDATAKDVARVVNGEKVEARFKSVDNDWTTACPREGFLAGWSNYDRIFNFIDDKGDHYRFCQVYNPPQWWLDKPDPGEGYRLLEKFPPEPKQRRDWYWDEDRSVWSLVGSNGEQAESIWYRRRIETNSPEKLESSRSKDKIPSGWAEVPDDEPRMASDPYWSQAAKDWVIIGDSRVEYANRDKWPAIRRAESQISMKLMADCCYTLPSGHSICITEKGFEVLL